MMQPGTRCLDDRYEVAAHVQASMSDTPVKLGKKGRCRYCGSGEPKLFHKKAHTLPEALGNKWVFSVDECDCCNSVFSLYEGALADALGPVLTLGGVKGKANKIRQTGRSKGETVLRRDEAEPSPRVTGYARIEDHRKAARFNPSTGLAHIRMPMAPTPFRPRHAYKALAKIGIALLPSTDLDQFSALTAWVLDAKEQVPLSFLGVGLSIGSLGNSPPLVAGTLLRCVDPVGPGPYMVLVVSAGSVCLQIELPREAPTTIDPVAMATVGIEWTATIGDGAGAKASISYGPPILLDWASPALRPQPIEAIDLAFDPQTGFGRISPIFRA